MSLLRRSALLVLFGTLAALGAPVPAARRLPTLGFDVKPQEPVIGLIVQFREPAACELRAEAIAARVADLRRDLGRLEDRGGPRTNAVTEPARIERTFSRVLFAASIRVRRELVQSVAALPYVAAVHVDRKFTALGRSAGAREVAARRAIANTAGAGVTVAVIDTGIDYHHPALGGGFGAGFKVTGGWDFVNDDADPMDDHGHGTHVAGIIAADGGGVTGVAPGVSLVAYKVLNAGGFGREQDIIAAVERAVDPDQNGDTSDHVDVANMSLGGPAVLDDPLAQAVENAIAAGVVFCLSSGNSGTYGDLPSPALAPSAISVGAVDAENTIASFSTRGPSPGYAIKPEVVAPGVNVRSTFPGDTFEELSGTSMASPYVAGVAALVKAAHRDWTPEQIKAAVVSTSLALEGDVMTVGAGRADPSAAQSIATLPLPSLLSFGQDDSAQSVWTTSRDITLRNLASTPQTLHATAQGMRAGVTLRVTPPEVTLAAGESKTVHVELTVTNALVPAPRSGSLSFGGRVEWSGGAAPLHVPWAFVKAAYLTIENADGGFAYAAVFGDSGRTMTDEFLGATRIFRPLEKVDVLMATFSSPAIAMVDENVQVEGAPVATFHVDDASFNITLDTADENGNALDDGTRECHDKVVLSFPHGGKLGFEASTLYRTRFGPFSPRIRLFVAQTCGDVATSTMYAALHEPLAGLAESVTSTSHPRWLRQDVRFGPEVPRDESMTSALAMLRFAGPDASYYYDGGSFFLMHGTESQLKILFTPSPSAEVDLVSMLERWGRCYDAVAGHDVDCPSVDNIFLYLDEHHVTAETDLFLDVSPMGYQLPLGEPMTFGRAPVSPQVRFDSFKSGWGMIAFWMGPLGERRIADTLGARAAVYDSTGALLAAAPVGFSVDEPLPPGRYRVESVDPDLVVGNVRGTATFTGWLDTTRSDFFLPMFTGLRIVDDDARQVSVVERNSHPSLVFSVADMIRGKIVYLTRVPPREEVTRVEYRLHGTTEWHPLTALVTARHYPFSAFLNGGVGTIYRADLTAVAAALTGAADLRVYAEDTSGNTAELRLEPAFVVGATSRTRAVKH